MATMNWRSDVHYFEGIVKLENVPSGLRPGMTAEVEIALPRLDDVLAVPSEAVRVENGHDFCFVVHEDGLERREVKLGQVTSRALRGDRRDWKKASKSSSIATKDDLEREDIGRFTPTCPRANRRRNRCHPPARSPRCTDRIKHTVWSG